MNRTASHIFGPELRGTIARNVKTFSPAQEVWPGLRKAAVTVIIATDRSSGRASVIVTLRPGSMRRHGAQYALPGGRLDAGETALEAAMRETSEELGLELKEEDIIGRLDDFPTRSGFCITPFVAWCEDVTALTPDASEVAAVYFIPLEELESPAIPRLEPEAHGDQPVMSAYFPTLGHDMFAPTAAILYQFREIALEARTTRVSHFEQPRFAWK